MKLFAGRVEGAHSRRPCVASAARFCGLRKLRKYPLGTSVRMPLTPSPCTSSLRTTCGRIQQMSQVRLILPVHNKQSSTSGPTSLHAYSLQEGAHRLPLDHPFVGLD